MNYRVVHHSPNNITIKSLHCIFIERARVSEGWGAGEDMFILECTCRSHIKTWVTVFSFPFVGSVDWIQVIRLGLVASVLSNWAIFLSIPLNNTTYCDDLLSVLQTANSFYFFDIILQPHSKLSSLLCFEFWNQILPM